MIMIMIVFVVHESDTPPVCDPTPAAKACSRPINLRYATAGLSFSSQLCFFPAPQRHYALSGPLAERKVRSQTALSIAYLPVWHV